MRKGERLVGDDLGLAEGLEDVGSILASDVSYGCLLVKGFLY